MGFKFKEGFTEIEALVWLKFESYSRAKELCRESVPESKNQLFTFWRAVVENPENYNNQYLLFRNL